MQTIPIIRYVIEYRDGYQDEHATFPVRSDDLHKALELFNMLRWHTTLSHGYINLLAITKEGEVQVQLMQHSWSSD